MLSNDFEDLIEQAYWEFDARRNGYSPYIKGEYSERANFKMALRKVFNEIKEESDNAEPLPHDINQQS